MRLLIDSYSTEYDGKIKLSGESTGIDGVGKKVISDLTGGETAVNFKKIDDEAKALIKNKLNKEYSENSEGFIINISDTVTVYADTDRASLYAAYSLKARYEDGLDKGVIYSFPSVPHRSVRIFLPPKSELSYFKKFVDMLVQLGYNAILLEIGGAMEFKRHPEINSTWAEYCKSMLEFNGKTYVAGNCYKCTKNSIHTYNANGDIYSQDEMREIVAYCNERCIEIIPEVPSLTHSEYILISHPELRECDDEPFASTACPSNPDLYKLVFDLYDEVIDVFKPSMLHIGHDEWWVMCVCDKCKDKNPADLYVEDVMKSYNYLKARGIKTMMWADKLIRVTDKAGESHGGSEKHVYNLKTDKTVNVMGKDYPLYERHWFKPSQEALENGFHQHIRDTADCIDKMPKDIMYVNWYWTVEPRLIDEFIKHDLEMIYGNCTPPALNNYKKRFEYGAKGFSVSSWIETTEKGLQLWETMFGIGYGTAISWGHDREEWEYEKNLFDVMQEMYLYRNRDTLAGDHIEVLHTMKDRWQEGDKLCEDPYYDDEKLTVGEYEIEYSDGRVERVPVQYRCNIGTLNAKTMRWDSDVSWSYMYDNHIAMTASVCMPEKHDDGIWYKTVFPIKKGAVKSIFVPRKGFEDKVLVKSVSIK